MDSVSDKEEDEATDYVFRIVFPNSQNELGVCVCVCLEFRNIYNLHSLLKKHLFIEAVMY